MKFWRDAENKRQFFINIAKMKGFDPLVAANWYSVTIQDILTFKVLNTHSSSSFLFWFFFFSFSAVSFLCFILFSLFSLTLFKRDLVRYYLNMTKILWRHFKTFSILNLMKLNLWPKRVCVCVYKYINNIKILLLLERHKNWFFF